IQYGPVGFVLGAGTSVNTPAATYTLSGLTPGTGYAVYIRSNCGGTSLGAWDGPYNIYTTLSTNVVPTYDYGFETGTLGSAGWSALRTTTGVGTLWSLTSTDADTPGYAAQAGTQFAIAGANGGVSNTWLFSRGITMAAGGSYSIKYWVKKVVGAGAGGTNTLAVKLGNAKTVAAMTTNVTTAAVVTSTTWTQKTATYTPTTAGTYYVGFNYTSPAQVAANFGWIAVDTFNVTAPLGLADNSLNTKFDIYPNPASDLLNVANFEGIRINGVTMTDLNGRVVKRNTYSAVEDVEVNVSDLASGIYLLNIETDLGSVTKKIMKK
ncbi:MAG: T9SS type A sorting domain-containing protein, partial [Sphingobacteriales bacterium]